MEKLKEAAISVVPVMVLVWLLHLLIAPLDKTIWQFMVGGILLIIGLAIDRKSVV